MKSALNILFFLQCTLLVFSQGMTERQFFGIAGNSAIAGDTQVCWSIGETFVSTLIQGNCVLTQGFQQPDIDFTSDVFELESLDLSYKIFPNPVVDILNIQINASLNSEVNIRMYDLNGNLIFSKKAFVGEALSTQISLSDISSGMYVIQFSNVSHGMFFSHPIQKFH